MLGSFTTEKRDVSSAKSLAVEVILSDKSWIYTKKNRGPKMEPRRTLDLTGNQFDDHFYMLKSLIKKTVNKS